MTQNKIIRSQRHGSFKMCSSKAWGKYLIRCADPDGINLSKFEREGFQLIKDFPVLPPNLWSRYISLCFYMCPEGKKLSSLYHDSQMEVQVCFLRDAKTLTKWKIVVPKQIVSGISVMSELNENIDIETGEEYDQFPPQGWVHAGSSHSHNTMDAFFSVTDDKSELTVPGLHIVIGNIDHKKLEYTYQASIVLRKNRKQVEDLEDVVDTEPLKSEFYPDVLNYIETVVKANDDLYSNKKPSRRFWSKNESDLETPEASEVPFFDEDGNPSSFLMSLDKTNSDLFDDVENLAELRQSFINNSDVQLLIKDQLEAGVPMQEIIQSIEEAKKDLEEVTNEV